MEKYWKSPKEDIPEVGAFYLLFIENTNTGKFYTTLSMADGTCHYDDGKDEYVKRYNPEDLGWSNPYGRSRHILVDIEIPFKKYSESMRNIKAVNSTLDVSELQVRSYVKLSDISYPAHIEHTCKCPCGKNK